MASFFITFDLNWFQTGLIFAFNALALTLSQIVVGYFTDKYSEILLKIGIFLLALSSFLIIFSYDFISLLIFAILIGIALGFQHSISYATTSKMFVEERDIMLGRQGAAGDMGKCVAVFLSALIILIFTWQFALITWSLITFGLFIIIFFNFRNIKFEDHYLDNSNLDLNLENYEENKPVKFLIALIIGTYIIYAAAYTMVITNLATYLRVEKIGLVSEFSGLILGFTILFGVIGAYSSGIFKSKLGMSKSIILVSILLICLFSLYLYLNTNDLIITLIFFGTVGFLLYIIYPQLLSAVNNFVHPERIGFGFGLVLSLGWFGNFLGALIGGYFAELYSANMFYILGIIILFVLIINAVIMQVKYNI
jgi:predicted MFS family arabinose efflux permease